MYRVRHLRLSNFGSVLEMLGDDDADDASGTTASIMSASSGGWRSADKVHYAFDSVSIAGEGGCAPLDRVTMIYGESPHATREILRAPHPRKSSKSVAEELALHEALTPSELKRIRREFAARNHPDRVPTWQRDEATQRMTIANVLIDRALKRTAARGR